MSQDLPSIGGSHAASPRRWPLDTSRPRGGRCLDRVSTRGAKRKSSAEDLGQRCRAVQKNPEPVQHVAAQDTLLAPVIANDVNARQGQVSDLHVHQIEKDLSPLTPLTSQTRFKCSPRSDLAQHVFRNKRGVRASVNYCRHPLASPRWPCCEGHATGWKSGIVCRQIGKIAHWPLASSNRPPLQDSSRGGAGVTGAMSTGNNPNCARTRCSSRTTSSS